MGQRLIWVLFGADGGAVEEAALKQNSRHFANSWYFAKLERARLKSTISVIFFLKSHLAQLPNGFFYRMPATTLANQTWTYTRKLTLHR